MEEFKSEINLGDVVTSGYANQNAEQTVAPISYTETLSEIQTQQVETRGVIDANSESVATPIPPVENTESIKKEEYVVRDEFRVPTVILKDLISKARKVGTSQPMNVPSQVINIELNINGIKVNTSNNKVDYECVNTDIRFTKSFKTCVDIKLFGELLSSLDFAEVELKYDEVNSVMTVVTSSGSEYNFPQKIDISTNQTIELSLKYPIAYEDMTAIDYTNLVDVISKSKPVRDFPNIGNEWKGVYFTSLVLSGDKTIIYMQDNQDILKTQKFFVEGELCDLIPTLGFNASNFRIGFTTNTKNEVIAITLSDGNTTICGNVESDSGLAEDVCSRFWNTEFAHKIKIDTRKFINSLKRIMLFMNLEREDCPKFEVSSNLLKITPQEEKAREVLVIGNDSNYSSVLNLPIIKLQKILASVKSDTMYMTFDDNIESCICLEFDNCKWIISKAI